MSMQRTIIKVFLASPGDLSEERRAAKKIVDEENRNHASPQGYQFELVGWEDTVAQHGRAQEVINRDLDQCDYFVGMLYKRWGTPPGPTGGPYSSGFEEEYERSEAKFKATGKPEISILFRNLDSGDVSDAGPQLKKVLDFKKKFSEEFRGFFHTFADEREFEDRFRSILAKILRKEVAEASSVEIEEDSKTLESTEEPDKSKVERSDGLFSASVREFVVDLISRPTDPESYEYTAPEVARLRLLGATLKRSENDETVIGVHDANLLYKEFRFSAISERERQGLLDAGLSYFGSQNAPIWKWLSNSKNAPLDDFVIRTGIGTNLQRKHAFSVMELLPDDLSKLGRPFTRNKLIEIWLEDDEADLVVAALNYLAKHGKPEDLPQIDNILDSSDASISKAAVSAKIAILLSEGSEAALKFIAGRDDADVSDMLADLILSRPETITTDLLRECALNRSKSFQRRVAGELLRRGELTKDMAKMLVASSDPEIRLLGSTALKSANSEYSLSDARKDIVKPKGKSIFSAFSTEGRDFAGEAAFERYRHMMLCAREQAELEGLVENEGLYDHHITFALYDKCFTKYRGKLIENLNDGFETFLQKRIDVTDPSATPDDKLREFICRGLVQKSVELIATKRDSNCISAVRKALDRFPIDYSDETLLYLEKFGSWEDVPRMIVLSEKIPLLGDSLISIRNNAHEYGVVAKAMLKFGNGRIADMLSMEMPGQLWSSIIYLMSKPLFVTFDNTRITSWLHNKSDSERKMLALKCVASMPKARQKKILDDYIAGGKQYYYNVVSWLDLGISLDVSRSRNVAKITIDKMKSGY